MSKGDVQKEWTGLRCFVRATSNLTVKKRDGDKMSEEVRYYLGSLNKSAKNIGGRIRSHWGIENRLHWALDIAFNKDRYITMRRQFMMWLEEDSHLRKMNLVSVAMEANS